MNPTEEIQKLATAESLEVTTKHGEIKLHKVLAERKAFLSKKKLEYFATVKISDDKKEIEFNEMLKESGSGLSTGGDSDMSAGFGFKAGTYSSGMGGLKGTIEEQSTLFGKQYNYEFDYGKIRTSVEEIAKNCGYQYKYKIL